MSIFEVFLDEPDPGIEYATYAFEGLTDVFREMDPDRTMTAAEVVTMLEQFLDRWKEIQG